METPEKWLLVGLVRLGVKATGVSKRSSAFTYMVLNCTLHASVGAPLVRTLACLQVLAGLGSEDRHTLVSILTENSSW